jgi:hypothetical protein
MDEQGDMNTVQPEEMLDEVIARNEASINRIHQRIEELRELLAKLAQAPAREYAT